MAVGTVMSAGEHVKHVKLESDSACEAVCQMQTERKRQRERHAFREKKETKKKMTDRHSRQRYNTE